MVDTLTFERKIMKGKKKSRTVSLHDQCKEQLLPLCKHRSGNDWLFESTETEGEHMTRQNAHMIIKKAAAKAQLKDQKRISAHAFRKSFAGSMYEASGHDLLQTAAAMGHDSPETTRKYLAVNHDKLNKAIMNQSDI